MRMRLAISWDPWGSDDEIEYPDQSDWLHSVDPEIYTKMLRNLTEKLKAKLSLTTHGYSTVKFACLYDGSSEFFELETSPVEGQSLQQKDKKRRKRKGKKNK